MGSIASSIIGGGAGGALGGASPLGLVGQAGGAVSGAANPDGTINTINGLANSIGDPFNARMPGANTTVPTNGQQIQDAYTQQQSGLQQQQNFANAVGAMNGLANQNAVYGQLQGVANGTGPNPAQAQLAQATGANVANQAALMAGQRGSGANAGLLARQAAMQGANTQQQAANQAATLQANQSLSAINAAGNIANQQVGTQANALNSFNSNALQGQQNLLNANQGYNSNQANLAGTSAGIENSNADRRGNLIGNLTGGIGAALGLAEGGMVPASAGAPQMKREGPRSHIGQMFAGQAPSAPPAAQMMAYGGPVKAMLSPGERYLPPKAVEAVREGKTEPMKAGMRVPGKAPVKGAKNSYSNDVVPADLEEGGLVLPRSVTQCKDPAAAAHKFVSEVMAKQALKGK